MHTDLLFIGNIKTSKPYFEYKNLITKYIIPKMKLTFDAILEDSSGFYPKNSGFDNLIFKLFKKLCDGDGKKDYKTKDLM